MFEDLSGAALAVALAQLDPGAMSADAALSYALGMHRVASWAAAGEAAGVARLFDAVGLGADQGREVAAEVRAGYGCSAAAAGSKIHLALAAGELPAAAVALAAGRIDLPRVWALVEATSAVSSRAGREQVAARLLDAHDTAVGGLTQERWRRLARRIAVEVDPASAEERRSLASRDRGAWHRSTCDGMGELVLVGPVDATAACEAALDARARAWRSEGQTATLDQLRFDAAVDLLTSSPDGRAPAGAPLVSVTVPLSALLGLDDAPGDLAGTGPVPASTARELAQSAPVWRRLLTDPADGHLVVQDVKSYRPSEAQRRFLLARHEQCAARGCGARRGLQLDHDTPWPSGATSVTNLVPLCSRDHNAKTERAWHHVLDPDSGALTQTSPLGRVHRTEPLAPPGATGIRIEHPPDPLPMPDPALLAATLAEDRAWLDALDPYPRDECPLDDPALDDAREALAAARI